MVGDNSDGVVKPHNLTHAFHGFSGRVIDTLYSTTKHGRLRQRRDLHAWRPNVDAIDGRSVDLRRCVEALGRCADELKILWPLERHIFGNGHASSVGGEFAVCATSPRR